MSQLSVNNNQDNKTAENEFKLFVAIDFGTDGMGVAYSYENIVHVHDKWKSKKYGTITKPKTIILLDDEGETAAVGMDAKHAYMSLTGKQRNQWMLFERFKMSLYEDKLNYTQKNNNKKFQKVGISNELTAVNGKKCASGKVFIAAFRYIHKISKKYLRKQKIKVSEDAIQWIITVPAIWNDNAKTKMKNWAIKAGLFDADSPDHCRIVYEPDCASLAIQYHMKQINIIQYDTEKMKKMSDKRSVSMYQNDDEEDEKLPIKSVTKMKSPFQNGDKYILIDAGGGTVDIACHQVMGEFGVKEIFYPSGGKWGSCYIDDQYIALLENIFSKKFMDQFKKEEPNVYVEIIHYFQEAKATFLRETNDITHNVKLPYRFLGFMEESITKKMKQKKRKYKDSQGQIIDAKHVRDLVKNTQFGTDKGLLFIVDDSEGQYLQIGVKIWKNMFDYVINPTVKHVENLLNQPSLMRKCKYLCLVGGLSSSAYFQYRMKMEFGPLSKYTLIIITPSRPILSVVAGAAYFGITKDYVKARRLKYSYGIIGRIPKLIAVANNVPKSHIKKYTVYDKFWKQELVRGCVRVFAHKNEEIYLNQVKTIPLQRNYHNDIIVENIICSNLDYPKTKDDGEIVGTLDIPFYDMDKDNLDIVTEFHFSGTVLKIFAYPKKTPQNKQTLQLNYITHIVEY